MAGEVECHPSRQYSSFQIGLSGNQGICCSSVHQIHNDSTFAFCRHDIKLLKSDLDITHPDAMIRAASSPPSLLALGAFLSQTFLVGVTWQRTFTHCLASTHLRSTSESNSLHPAHSGSSLESKPHTVTVGTKVYLLQGDQELVPMF